jgi:cobalt-zinc-cadmium efflux system outer membrane protein
LLAVLVLALPQPLTLAEAQARAEKGSGELQAARLGEPVAQAGVAAAGQLANPTLTLSLGPDEPTLTAALAVKVPLFGQRGAAITAAEKALPAAQAEVSSQRVKLHAAVRRAYFALAAAQAQVELAGEAVKLATELERMAREKFNGGSAPQLEAEQASLALRRAAQDKADRETAARDARQDLARLFGEPEAEPQATDPILPKAELPPLEALLAKANQHPDVRALEAQRQAALARAQVERVAVRPLPEFSVTLERLYGGNPTPYVGVRGGVAFELPVLSWNRGKVGEAEAQAAQAEAQARAALIRLQSEIRAARAKAEAALARSRFFTDDQVPAALRVEQMARAGYQLGRAPLLSVLQAQGEVAGARGKSIDAAAEAQKSLADLEEATGAE